MKKHIILLLSLIITLSTSAQVIYQVYNVTGTETWDINTYPHGVLIEEQLIIEDGGTLTISANVVVKFSPSATAYVKMGGKLFLYGATLAANTNYAWTGIIVKGNPNYNFNQLAYHGLIVMDDNASIGGAKFAIDFQGIQFGTGGGTGIIKNSTFKNNATNISQNPSPKCRIIVDNCNFIVDDNYLNYYYWNPWQGWVNYTQVPLAIWAVQTGFSIKNSTFNCLLSNNVGGSPAIFSHGGNTQIKSNAFIDWATGVAALSYDPTDIITIADNTFTTKKSTAVINLTGQTNSLILRNDIKAPDVYGSHCIHYKNSTNFIIEENNFINNNTEHDGSIGIWFENTPPYINQVYNNTFTNFHAALKSQNTARDNDGNGLVYKCNIFSDNRYDIWDWGQYGYGLAEYQGSFANEPNAPAGNQFSWAGQQYSDISNWGLNFFYIYHDQSNLNHEPQDYTHFSVTAQANENPNASYDAELSCPSNFPNLPGIYEIDPNVQIPHMIDARTMSGSIENYISHLKDGGDTEGLKSTVLASIPSEAYDLYLDLMDISPYLSNEVIKVAIQKEDVLDNAMIRDIMVANAHSAKDDDLVASLDDRITPMPGYMKDEILEGKNIASGLEVLKSGLSHYRQETAKHFGLLKYHYMNDTVNVSASRDSLIILLDNAGRKDAKYHLAFVYFNEQDYTNAEAVLDNIPLVFDLNTNEYDEYNSMLDYYAIRKEMQINDQSLLNADSLQLDALLDIAENGYGMAKTYACNVLSLYELCDLHDEKSMAAIDKEHKRMKDWTKSQKSLKIAPNPATDIITVHYSLKGLPLNSYFQIIAYDGSIVKQVRVEKATDQKVIYIGNLNPGVYMLNLINNQKSVESGRFIKVN